MAEVRAEIVGNVWKLLVAQGDAVSAGDTLAVLESMKMEIPVHAPVTGVVGEVPVAEGQIVQEGDVVVVIEGSSTDA
ncbi:biotin/lipoyl-binding carrier protein [Aeromicrobium sp. IC_218]|uniref:biotin/lipoyl-binding carrier protein n=1 Tax=Aeromicrobium sp. IC_218 TaxID=2545468 RepID=UPI001040BDE0|nr:biotin/lipoyl-binding carrier protein [Aeromicrobium sp. IC_218]TCI96979.1 biotin/lipoyl-binding carrier protein [Aeromicrobium sp. IC_218]